VLTTKNKISDSLPIIVLTAYKLLMFVKESSQEGLSSIISYLI